MISITDKSQCCGCNACGDICPVHAITFSVDEEGFLFPSVDKDKCINCGLCEKVCPCLHPPIAAHPEDKPKSFAAVHKLLPTRFASTSGGAYSALAKTVSRMGGALAGAVWTEDFHVRLIVSADPIDLLRIRGSKYAQADARDLYRDLKPYVEGGKPVLICGTPCQISAVRNYLAINSKPIPDNVYLVDLICCGNNSPMVMEKFLALQEEKAKSKIVAVRQKSKELGWRKLTFKISFKNGKVVYEPVDKCLFTQGFIGTHQYCRPSCYDCKFKSENRAADITIADYWGDAKKLNKGMDDDLGTSVIFVRTEKGRCLLEKSKGSLVLQELQFDVAVGGNRMYSDSVARPKTDRAEFFKALREDGFAGVTRFFPTHPAPAKVSLPRRTVHVLRRLHGLWRSLPMSAFMRTLRVNGLRNVLSGKPLILAHGSLTLEDDGVIELAGDLNLGTGFLRTAPSRTSLAVRPGGTLITHGANTIYYGADIEVFPNARLEMGRDCVLNLNANIICGGSIKIGDGVSFGRNVTVRDNNGGHWMNTPGYSNIRPVEIGDHAWLTEGCTIMPGVKIGAGAVVGAKAVVFDNVPANSLVLGNPAKVVAENVEWKR